MNRLSSEASPYLLQHADNPVDWLPWGEEALERARRQDKPIFLSIGYAACHWCHVMAHESFEDEGTAAILNQHFIPVKVDREERPDVDAVYMDAVVALTGQGGWPLSVFLTPAGEPFYGGTYFPPERRHGLPSFRELLETIAASWRDDRSRIQEAARRLTEHVAGSAATAQEATDLDPSLEGQAMEALLRQYDWDQGGWGGAPKFPQAPVTAFLLRRHHRTQDPMAVEMATHCLRAMANGGLFDHVGGGFHRYAVDRTWTVPHFEKMLYDNALLGRAYLEAWLVTGQPPLLDAATATLAFMQRELLTPQGAFGASLDADSEGEEGRFYVWSFDELRAAFTDPDDLALLQHAFDLQPGGNFEGKIVLRRAQDDEAVAATLSMEPDQVRRKIQAAVHRLREVRSSRVRPALDDKILAGWNGLALGAWASAARILRRPDDLNIAQTLADFLLTAMSPGGRLHRAWRMGVAKQPAFLADLAAVASGLLDLYQVDFNPRWLNASRQLAGEILSQFADPAGGFFDTAADQAALIARPKTLQDTPIPSGGAQATCLFLRLEALTGEPRYRQAALGALGTTLATAIRYPAGFSVWLQAAALAHEPLPQLVIAGDPDSQGFQALAHEAYRFFQPRLVIAGGEISGQDLPLLSGKVAMEGRPTAYLCRDFACDAPTISPETLAGQLRGLR